MSTPYRTKKSLGQHFLHDQNIARKIVMALDPQPGEKVLEIGPGPGALTGLLAESGADILAMDIDKRAVEELLDSFAGKENLCIRQGDILSSDLTDLDWRGSEKSGLTAEKLRIIGNLPYNITSQILFHLCDHHHTVRDAVFMIQKEVAERIVAAPGCKEYGILSVILQTHADVSLLFNVSPNVFIPRPKIWSSVIHFSFRNDILNGIGQYRVFRRVVKETFGKRRKMLSNSLKYTGFDPAALMPPASDWMNRRPEELSVHEFITLSNALSTVAGQHTTTR